MRLDIRRDGLLIIPEHDQDRAYLEDTMGVRSEGATLSLQRIADVSLGYRQGDCFVLKAVPTVPTSISNATST